MERIPRSRPRPAHGDRGANCTCERRRQPLLPRSAFAKRLALPGAAGSATIAASLGTGVLGHNARAGLPRVDALPEASKFVGGMEPVHGLRASAAEVFASRCALHPGLVLVGATAVVFSPLVHGALHRFHLEGESEG